MTVASGSRLGPYEVISPLGAGGMGEVYKAKDPRLGREVAIKVLPASFSQDADRLRRFEQEARAAGVLNHPNITAVYDIGAHDSSPYIVTELLEGETLRSRLSAGSISVRKAIDYAVQIAKGLSAAHEKGIVHRDLKPENVFLTRDGRVKILDFGLAKLKQPEDAHGKTDLPTEAAGTEPGVVMGTMGYMSPEQVRGKPADRRSDLFSFGAILYEMLSGQRAFRGDTAADTITAILTKEPPDLAQTNKEIHPGLDRIVRHCLEKNPEERFESARDVAFDLEALSGLSGASAATGTHLVPAPRGRTSWPLLVLAAVLGAAIASPFLFFVGKKAGYVRPPSFRQLTFRRGLIGSARFAPDGQTILYAASWDGRPMEIFVSRLDSPESRPFGLAGAEVLSISRSGEMAVSLGRHISIPFTRTGTLARIGMTGGGSPKEVLEDVQWADWSPDGQSLAVLRDVGGKHKLEFPIGKVLYETAGWIGHPRVSPGGDEVAFLDHPLRGDDGGSVTIIDRSGKRRTVSGVFASAQGLCWAPEGNEVWFTGSTVGFNRGLYGATRAGRVRLLAQGTGGLTIEDVSKDGRVLIVQDKARQGISAFLAGAQKEQDFSWLDWSLARDISPNGSMLLFDESGEGGGAGYSAYVRRADGSPAVRLGQGSASGLSPDGRLALAIVGEIPSQRLVLYPVGAGEPRLLPVTGLRIHGASWLPDGRILFSANEPDHGIRIWTQRIEDAKPKAISPEGYRLFDRCVSPDGKLASVLGPDQRLYLYPVEGGEPTPIPGLAADDIPSGWFGDGRSLLVRRRGEVPAKIFVLDVHSGRKELWKELMPPDPAGISTVGSVWATPDRKWYAYSYIRSLADLYVLEGLK
jgi:Tol biopolymer transport system component